jgi:hypothetical protein
MGDILESAPGKAKSTRRGRKSETTAQRLEWLATKGRAANVFAWWGSAACRGADGQRLRATSARIAQGDSGGS